MENIQVLTTQLVIVTVLLITVFHLRGKIVFRVSILSGSMLLMLFTFLPAGKNMIEGLRYKNQHVIEYQDTPYSNLTYTLKDDQVTAYSNTIPFLSSHDVIWAEESVHYTTLQHPDPKQFLLL